MPQSNVEILLLGDALINKINILFNHHLATKTYTLSAALVKARKYCAYQERSHQEVRDKLYDLGMHERDVEQGIAILIEEGFINEERFAIAFAGGKFRIKQWGKLKIKYELKARHISGYCIKKALASIDSDEYMNTLEKVAAKQVQKIKEKDPVKKKFFVASYMIRRGYENDLVWDVVTKLLSV